VIYILCHGALSPGVKQLGHETDHLPFSAEVKIGIILQPINTSSWRSA